MAKKKKNKAAPGEAAKVEEAWDDETVAAEAEAEEEWTGEDEDEAEAEAPAPAPTSKVSKTEPVDLSKARSGADGKVHKVPGKLRKFL